MTTKPKRRDSIVMIGAGLPTLINAHILAQTGYEVTIMERSSKAGGLYRGKDFQGRTFDDAMHVVYSTGIENVDLLLERWKDKYNLSCWSKIEKDLAGSCGEGGVNEGSPYPDFRNKYTREEKSKILLEMQSLEQKVSVFNAQSLSQALEGHFGHTVGRDIGKIFSGKFGIEPGVTDPSFLRAYDLRRVVLDDYTKQEYLDLGDLTARLAYQNQREIPVHLLNDQVAYYPKQYGWGLVIDSIVSELRALGVAFIFDVEEIRAYQGAAGWTFEYAQVGVRRSMQSKYLVISAGYNAAIKVLDVPNQLSVKVESRNTSVLYYELQEELLDRRNYYYFDYRQNSNTYRYTLHYMYCSDLRRQNRYLVSQEVWHRSDQEALKSAIEDFKDFSGFSGNSFLRPSYVSEERRLMPIGGDAVASIEAHVLSLESDLLGLIICGPFTAEGVILFPSVARQLYEKLDIMLT